MSRQHGNGVSNGSLEGAHADVTGVVLAGGKARRMGGTDKGLVPFRGRPMVTWVLDALRPQVHSLVLNANRNAERYASYGAPVLADSREGYLGPLSGMATAMRDAKTVWIVSAPCDSPFVPDDLVARLYAHHADADIVTAHDGQRLQPVFSLIRVELLESLNTFLDAGERKIDRWFEQHRHARADFSDIPNTFANVNTLEELARLDSADPQLP